MGIDLPKLDDREHEELLDQAKKLIPAYSDEWTDFNPHDPGITILEILAWLTETHTYQVDQITDEHRRKYLRLIGHSPRPPEPATARIQLEPPEQLSGSRIPAGSRLAVTDGTDDLYQFETAQDLVLAGSEIEQVVTVDGTGMSDQTEANRSEEMFYLPFGEAEAGESSFYLGFGESPFADTDRLSLSVEYHDENLPEPTPARAPFTPSVELTWEYYNPADASWQPLSPVTDGTHTFYQSGLIELERQDGDVDGRLPEKLYSNGHWIRCRVETGGYEIPPQIDAIRTNVVSAAHAATVESERLRPAGDQTEFRQSPALDGQSYLFEHRPVLSADVFVDGVRFTEVADFDASGPNDPHYVLDTTAGTVTFGDGASGRVPDPDATITADYVYGGGADGNVSAGAVWRFSEETGDTPYRRVDVEPLGAATGGKDAESTAAALRRARRDLRRPYRAVTTEDYRYIASNTPGLRIGRTGVWRESDRAVVTVVPYAPEDVHSPEPSEAFLERVREHLTERTLLADRVTVSGPRYVRLELTVTGGIRTRYAQSGYETAITAAIKSYLHPLSGFDGEGWPFGRSLVFEELRREIESVDAVDYLSDINVTAHGGTVVDAAEVRIDETALFSVADVTVNMTASQRD